MEYLLYSLWLLQAFVFSTPPLNSNAHTAATLHLRDYSVPEEMISYLTKQYSYIHVILGTGKIITVLEKLTFLSVCYGMLPLYQDSAMTWASVYKTRTEKGLCD